MYGAGHATMQRLLPIHATSSEQAVVVIDQGRFGFTEFAVPERALAVTGGIHVVEIVPSELACRALAFPALDPALKVCVLPGRPRTACVWPT